VTGEPFDYQHWAFGEPNNDQAGSDYLESKNVSPLGYWNDEPEDAVPNIGYIVEYDTVKDSPSPRRRRSEWKKIGSGRSHPLDHAVQRFSRHAFDNMGMAKSPLSTRSLRE
jgi:hypothetical protein